MKKVLLLILPFVLTCIGNSSVWGQMSQAEVNRIVSRYIWSTPKWETVAEIRALRERVRQTGNPYEHRGNSYRQEEITVVPQSAEVPMAAVTVTSISGSTSNPPVTVTTSSSDSISVTNLANESELTRNSNRCEPNPTTPVIAVVQAPMFKTLQKDVYESLQFQLEQIRESLSVVDVSPETLAALLKEKGAETEQLTELISALENGEYSAVSRIWITSGGDPMEGSKISRTLNLLSLLEGIELALEEQEISVSDIKDFKKVFDRTKQDKQTADAVKNALDTMDTLVNILERYQEHSDNGSPTEISAPIGDVTLVLHPKYPKETVMALSEDTFIVGTVGKKRITEDDDADDEVDVLKITEGSLDDYLDTFPVSESAPVSFDSAGNQFTLRNTNADALTFALEGNKKTLASGETESYPVPSTGKIEFSVTKTRSVFSSRRRGRTTQQDYQDKQELSVARGVTYDCTKDAETYRLSPRLVQITLDNSSNTRPFYLLADNKPLAILPGET